MKKTLLLISPLLFFYSCSTLDGMYTGEKSSVELRIIAQTKTDSEYELTISGPAMNTIGPKRYQSGQTVRLFVPEGADRHFELKRYDKNGSLTDSAIVVRDVGSGINKIDISVKPLFRVQYDPNGGSGTAPRDTNYYTTGSIADVLKCGPDLNRDGHTFLEWNTAEDGSGYPYAIDEELTIGSGNVILYAQWTRKPTYTISYMSTEHTAGEGPVDLSAYETGAEVVVLGRGSLERDGFTFAGWKRETNENEEIFMPNSFITIDTTDISLYAQWTRSPTYSISYDGNDHSAGGPPVDSNAYEAGTSATILGKGTLEKAGFEFLGWTDDTTNGLVYRPGNFFTIGSQNETLYAVWTKNPTFTISYDGNGHTSGTVPTDPNEYEIGSRVKVLYQGSMTREGHTFKEWNGRRLGHGTSYPPGTWYTVGTVDDTLWAQWKIKQYTVAFNSNEGTDIENKTVDFNKKVTKPADPERAGHEFRGWFTDSSCTDTWNFDTDLVVNDTVLYAKWQIKQFTVTFDSRDGSAVEPQMVDYNSTPDLPTPEKQGYAFKGWFTDAGLWENVWNSDDAIISDTVLYAKWRDLVRITFNSTGGSPVSSQMAAIGDTIIKPENPTRSLYNFAGWYSDLDYTQQWNYSDTVSTALELFAKWKWGAYFYSYTEHHRSTANLDTNDFKIQNDTYFDSSTVVYTIGEPDALPYSYAGIGSTVNDEIRSYFLAPGSDTIAFSCRSENAITLSFIIATENATDEIYYGKNIDIGTEETEISIPISSLEQISSISTPTPINFDNLTSIVWEISKNDSINTDITEGYFSVWDIRIH